MDGLAIARLTGASLYYVAFMVYGAIVSFLPEGREWHPLRGILYDNLVVTGLNALLYTYLADSGDARVIFLVYSFSCVYLAQSMLRILTLRAYLESYRNVSSNEQYVEERRDQLRTLSILIFITLIAGFVIVLLPGLTLRYVVFVLDFGPFFLSVLLLIMESYRFNRSRGTTAGSWAMLLVYGTLIFWFGYPLVQILGPDFTGTISALARDSSYLSLDVVTKHLFMLLSAIYTCLIIRQSKSRDFRVL